MKQKLMITQIDDNGESLLIDWFHQETGAHLESILFGDNRLAFLDAVNVDDLTSLEGKEFLCSTFINKHKEVKIRPESVQFIEDVEKRIKEFSSKKESNALIAGKVCQKDKTSVTLKQTNFGKLGNDYKKKYAVIRKLKEALSLSAENKQIIEKLSPHLINPINELSKIISKEDSK